MKMKVFMTRPYALMEKSVTLGILLFLVAIVSINNNFVDAQWVETPPRYSCPTDRILYPCNCSGSGDDGVNVKCNNTNIASLSVGLRQIRTLIRHLEISECNIEKLYGDVFKPLTVKIMRIEDTPIKDISDGTFDGSLAESLEELYLINTWLTRVSPAIKNLTNLKILKIEKSRIAFMPHGVFHGMSKLLELTIAESKLSVISKNTWQGLQKVKKISLYKNNISKLERNTFKYQQNLELLDISHNSFTKLEPHFFSDLRRLLWLNISNNEVPKMSARVFARVSVLRVLNLNSNKITSLDANSFRGMRFMRRLYFADNQISRVGRGAFKAVSRIGTIDLARNNLTKIEREMFADLRFIDTIDVAENQIKQILPDAFKTIYLTKVNISHNQIEQIPNGAFKFCENMTVLDLSHNKIKRIAPEAFDKNSYSTEMRLSYNQFTSMSQIPMTYQKGIKILNASRNAIADVPKKTFPKLYELHTVDMSHNNLSKIDRSVFANLLSLRHLNLLNNSLTKLESSTFGKIVTLLTLDISHNKISKARRGVFQGLSGVRSIKVDYNQLKDIPLPPISCTNFSLAHNNIEKIKGRQPWPVMNSLRFLNLDYNRLADNIEPGRLQHLNTLAMLGLRGNGITIPPKGALGTLQSIQDLRMDDNNITVVGKDAFGQMRVLSYLSLSGNKINNITYGAFQNILQLQTLDLSNNELKYIPAGAFVGLKSLSHLDLSNNNLKRLQNRTHGLLDDCLSIRSVNLRNNNIPFITKKMFPEHKWIPYRLQHIDLSYNRIPVITKEIKIGTKHLLSLNVSHNILNNIRKDTLSNLTSLQVLDVSGNSLLDKVFIDEDNGTSIFGHLPNLTHLYLQDNRFTQLPIEDLVKHVNLRLLDLRNNRLTKYSPEFTELVKQPGGKGLDIKYKGNPIKCDCRLRPISYWLESVGRAQGKASSWDEALCASPKFLENVPIGLVSELKLLCFKASNSDALDDSVEDDFDPEKYQLNPDVSFREIKENGGGLDLKWYVSTNEDVGDFRLQVQSRSYPRSTLFSKDVSYSTRFQAIRGIKSDDEVTLCLLAKTSTGRIRHWRDEQCKIVGPLAGNAPRQEKSTTLFLISLFSSLLIVFDRLN